MFQGHIAGDNLLLSYRVRKNEAGNTARPLLQGSQLGPSSVFVANGLSILFFAVSKEPTFGFAELLYCFLFPLSVIYTLIFIILLFALGLVWSSFSSS